MRDRRQTLPLKSAFMLSKQYDRRLPLPKFLHAFAVSLRSPAPLSFPLTEPYLLQKLAAVQRNESLQLADLHEQRDLAQRL
jgi:hypothetical protein